MSFPVKVCTEPFIIKDHKGKYMVKKTVCYMSSDIWEAVETMEDLEKADEDFCMLEFDLFEADTLKGNPLHRVPVFCGKKTLYKWSNRHDYQVENLEKACEALNGNMPFTKTKVLEEQARRGLDL